MIELLPVKADKKTRQLKKRQVQTATTNQELVAYVASLQLTNAPSKGKTKKRGFFFGRKA